MKHVRDCRRARRAVLVGLALFLLVQAGLAVAVWQVLLLRDPPYGHKLGQLKQRLAVPEGEPRPLVVVQIGSSRTVYGLRGQGVEAWLSAQMGRPIVLFNMGLTGAGPLTNLLNLRRLLEEGIRPDLLLIEVLPFSLAEEGLIGELAPAQLPAHRLRYDEMRWLAQRVGAGRPGLEQEWCATQFSLVSDHRLWFVRHTAPTLLPSSTSFQLDPYHSDASGWHQMSTITAEEARHLLAAARLSSEHVCRTFVLSDLKMAALREAIERGQQVGAVALVLMPEGPAYRNWYPPTVWEQIHQALVCLSREYDVPLLDLRESVPEEGFFDSHHLYPHGASLYTRRLAERLVPLLLLIGPSGRGDSTHGEEAQ
jgi:hypothetical protein